MQEIPQMRQKQQYRPNYKYEVDTMDEAKQQYRLNQKYVVDTMDETTTIVQTKLEICSRYNG